MIIGNHMDILAVKITPARYATDMMLIDLDILFFI